MEDDTLIQQLRNSYATAKAKEEEQKKEYEKLLFDTHWHLLVMACKKAADKGIHYAVYKPDAADEELIRQIIEVISARCNKLKFEKDSVYDDPCIVVKGWS